MTQHSLAFSARSRRIVEYVAPTATLPALLAALGLRKARVLKLDCMGCEHLVMPGLPEGLVELIVGRLSPYPPTAVDAGDANTTYHRCGPWTGGCCRGWGPASEVLEWPHPVGGGDTPPPP